MERKDRDINEGHGASERRNNSVFLRLVIVFSLGLGLLSTAAEVKQAVTGDFGKNPSLKTAEPGTEDAMGIGFAIGGFAVAGVAESFRRSQQNQS